MIITKITEQAKNPDRVSIYVDDRFLVGIHKLVTIRLGLRVGMVLTDDLVQELTSLESNNSAWEYSLRSLAVASKSRSRMISKLTQRFGREKAEETTIKLVNDGLIDDSRMAESIVMAQITSKRKSRAEIIALLVGRGIDKGSLNKALELIPDEYELETAIALAKIKWNEGRGSIEKIAQYLGRKGFGYTVVRKACAELGLDAEEVG